MESIQLLAQAICYMEEHLLEDISYVDAARHVCMSGYHFHRTFRFITGMTANEYIRNRRLSLAGQELQTTDMLVIDAALKYGYDTPESFSKAFLRFHGVTPKQAKRKGTELCLFNPLVIKITMEGGHVMNYKIKSTGNQRFLALVKVFPNEIVNNADDNSIADFWTECHRQKVLERIKALRPEGKRDLYGLCGSAKKNETHFDYGIGILIDEETDVSNLDALFRSGYSIWETQAADYAVFKCFGTDGECIDEAWSKFYKEFVPQTGYTQIEGADFEIYSENGEKDLFCELWIPVKKERGKQAKEGR